MGPESSFIDFKKLSKALFKDQTHATDASHKHACLLYIMPH